MRKVLTLVMIYQHPKILLGMKKRGFGVGRWDGFGGKVLENESIEESAIRETKEEAGIEVKNLIKLGIINFEFINNSEVLEVHIFKAEECLGEPSESEEMRPQWFYIDEIPFAQMWKSDVYWMPLFLKNKKFKGKCLFD